LSGERDCNGFAQAVITTGWREGAESGAFRDVSKCIAFASIATDSGKFEEGM
jgi:hypothetical protein